MELFKGAKSFLKVNIEQQCGNEKQILENNADGDKSSQVESRKSGFFFLCSRKQFIGAISGLDSALGNGKK